MRLGLLGPAGSSGVHLREAAEFLVAEARADRVVYLGADRALDAAVEAWARQAVGGEPSLEGLLERAALRCAQADAGSIDEFVARERRLRPLRAMESLPSADAKSVEVCEGKIAILTYDKAALDEEDLLPASYLVFGRGSEPVARQVGPRWFLSPGPLGPRAGSNSSDSGIALLTHDENGASWSLYSRPGSLPQTLPLTSATAARVTVHP